jgi:hypothetical protein
MNIQKFLSILVLAGTAVTSLSAHHMCEMSSGRATGSGEMMTHHDMMRDMMTLKKKIKGKTLTFPGSLAKEGMAIKAKMLRMVAQSLKECGKLNFKAGSAEMKKYEQAAQKADALATAFEGLPVNKTVKKKFDKVDEWMNFMVEKKQVKARFLKEIAKQLGDSEMERKADKFASMVEKFKNMMQESSTGEESGEPMESRGCSVQEGPANEEIRMEEDQD